MPSRNKLAAIVLAGVAVSTLTACGSGSSKQTASSTPATSGANGFTAYTACLRQNGVTLPSFSPRPRPSRSPGARPDRSPGSGFQGGGGFRGGAGGFLGGNPPQGIDPTKWQAALKACQSVRPTFGGGQNGRNGAAFTAYRNCLSDHGVTFSGGPGAMPTSDPKVAAALKTCAPLRPSIPARRPTTAPSPNS